MLVNEQKTIESIYRKHTHKNEYLTLNEAEIEAVLILPKF